MQNLKTLRKQHNLSQQKLADILHVSQQSVYKYENGITSPDIETLIRMADYFNTSIDYLVEYTDISHKIEPVENHMLNAEELELLNNYRQLTSSQKEVVQMVIKEYHNGRSKK
ncbi:MAG: helix-turn-helix transcriptional regulator [Agathobacter sp.]|nr:helix-turn-helix transcriptional regulator [Agathobacter sp.]